MVVMAKFVREAIADDQDGARKADDVRRMERTAAKEVIKVFVCRKDLFFVWSTTSIEEDLPEIFFALPFPSA